MNDQPHGPSDPTTPEITSAHRPPQPMLQAQQHLDTGDLAAAETLYLEILHTRPQHAGALNGLGIVCQQQGRLHEAVDYFQRALARRPEFAGGHCNLGATLYALGRLDEAAVCFDRALALQPELAEAHNQLGMVRRGQGRLEEALTCYQRAVALAPRQAEMHNNLGNVLHELGRVQEAIRHFQQALTEKPDFAEAHNNLGFALHMQNRFDEAIAHYARAIELNPRYAHAHNNIAITLHDQGWLGEGDYRLDACEEENAALAYYRRALKLQPDFAAAHSNLLFALNYSARTDSEMLFKEARNFAECHEVPLTARREPHANDPDPQRRLRVGYVSGDFRSHSVAFFIEPLLTNRDRTRFEVFCYSCHTWEDDVTQRLKRHADHWRSLVGLSDEVAAQLIRADGIDILVDLAGHTEGNRLLVFAHKPAPVQVTYIGYPNTTGLESINYRFTDAWADPEGQTERYHTEALVRLPRGFLCYHPPDLAPSVVAPPCLHNGCVTFGSFNQMAKVTDEVVALWAELLHALPSARLLMKSGAFADADVHARCLARWQQAGIARERIELIGPIPDPEQHLARYGQVDIALDPFPYNGTTTTCEALWMGVPVITLAGSRHAGRVGVSLLTQVGLEYLIAQSKADYLALAVHLATDPERLTSLRRELRDCMATSPLCDAAVFTRDVEAAYRAMWRDWCVRQGQ